MISSFYIGASGMKTHASGMQVLGDNIANVNTVGYKSSQATFANLMSQEIAEAANEVGYSQLGMGSQVNDVKKNFSQGAFETTNSLTDMAVSGKGFFGVTDSGGEMYYTRAGNFQLDNEGYIVTPHGYNLQGTSITEEGQGATGSVRFEPDENGQITMDPKATTNVAISSNLSASDSSENDASRSSSDPYFSMASQWNGSSDASVPLDTNEYAYATAMTIYDSEGSSHELTVYYDEAINSDASGNSSYWEYAVGINPAEDGRTGMTGTSAAGLLMMGTLEFSSSGELENMSAFTNNGSGGLNLENWVPTTFDENGLPQFSATFDGGATSTVSLDLGLTNTSQAWNNTVSNAAAVGVNNAALPSFQGERGEYSTTNYKGSSSTTIQSQDGYGKGYLESFTVDNEGVVTGQYSNNESKDLWQVNLYNFVSEYGLSAEGDNLYAATKASGQAIQGFAGSGPFGDIAQSSLEQSNVDLAYEFVSMITNQRGFQANSKIITTSDSLLQNAIQMKK